jgi:hypothetical protein
LRQLKERIVEAKVEMEGCGNLANGLGGVKMFGMDGKRIPSPRCIRGVYLLLCSGMLRNYIGVRQKITGVMIYLLAFTDAIWRVHKHEPT